MLNEELLVPLLQYITLYFVPYIYNETTWGFVIIKFNILKHLLFKDKKKFSNCQNMMQVRASLGVVPYLSSHHQWEELSGLKMERIWLYEWVSLLMPTFCLHMVFTTLKLDGEGDEEKQIWTDWICVIFTIIFVPHQSTKTWHC